MDLEHRLPAFLGSSLDFSFIVLFGIGTWYKGQFGTLFYFGVCKYSIITLASFLLFLRVSTRHNQNIDPSAAVPKTIEER